MSSSGATSTRARALPDDWSTQAAGRLKELRTRQGLSQKDLAEPVCSAAFLSLVESGARKPSPKILDHLASRLEISVEELVSGRDPKRAVELQLRLQEARELIQAGRLDAAEAMTHDIIRASLRIDERAVRAKALENLASIQEKRGRSEAALATYREAEEAWRDQPLHLRFQTVTGIARAVQKSGDARLAIHMLESYLLDLDRAGIPDPTARMRVFSTLSLVYSFAGLPHRAAEAADEALGLTPRVPDPEQIACMNMNVARSMLDQGRDQEALEAIRKAEEAFSTLGWQVDAARAAANRGIIHMEKGAIPEARETFRYAIDVLKSAGRTADAALTMVDLARLEREDGDAGAALALLDEADGYLPEVQALARATSLRERGLCVAERDLETGKQLLLRAADAFREAGTSYEVGRTYKHLGDLQQRGGDGGRDAAETYRKAFEALDQAFHADRG